MTISWSASETPTMAAFRQRSSELSMDVEVENNEPSVFHATKLALTQSLPMGRSVPFPVFRTFIARPEDSVCASAGGAATSGGAVIARPELVRSAVWLAAFGVQYRTTDIMPTNRALRKSRASIPSRNPEPKEATLPPMSASSRNVGSRKDLEFVDVRGWSCHSLWCSHVQSNVASLSRRNVVRCNALNVSGDIGDSCKGLAIGAHLNAEIARVHVEVIAARAGVLYDKAAYVEGSAQIHLQKRILC